MLSAARIGTAEFRSLPEKLSKMKEKRNQKVVKGVILSAVQAALYTALMFWYMRRKQYFSAEKKTLDLEPLNVEIPGQESALADNETDTAEKIQTEKEKCDKDKNKENDDMSNYTRRQSFIITTVMFVVCFTLDILLYKYHSALGERGDIFIYLRAAFVNALCFAAALTDYKRRKIPNDLILAGIAVKVLIFVCEFVFCSHEVMIAKLKSDGLGFLLGFVMLLIIGIVSKGLGFGDVKLFGVIGVMMGAGGVMNILFVSLLFSAIAGITMIVLRKKNFKSSMPMAPFILAGTMTIEILGLF